MEEMLELAGSDVPLRRAVTDLHTALQENDVWQRWHAVRGDVDEQTREVLRGAREEATRRLSASAVDAFEPKLVFPRYDYRRQTLAEVIASLSGGARAYCDAFSAVNAMITLVADEVLAELVGYGPTIVVRRVENLVIEPGDHPTVSFETSGLVDIPRLGRLIYLDHPLVPDCVRAESVRVHLDAEPMLSRTLAGPRADFATGSETIHVKGPMLSGSDGVFESVEAERLNGV